MNRSLAILAIGLFSSTAFAQVSAKMSINGTSNLHDWQSLVTKSSVKMDLERTGTNVTDVRSIRVTVPVKGIDSEHDVMDTKTYEAFESAKFPDITFSSTDVRLNSGTAVMTGTLSMHGKSQPAVLKATYKVAEGAFLLNGSHTIDMTAFGMTPPTAVMGTIKVGKTVSVKYEVSYPL